MNIKTNITQDDYTAFVKHVARSVSTPSSDKVVRMIIALAFGLGAGVVMSLLNLSIHSSHWAAMLCGAFAGAFLLMVIIGELTRRQMNRLKPDDDGFVIGSQNVSLEDEGIRQRSGRHQALFQWTLIRAVAITDQHVFVMVDRIAGIILPKRAFASDADREAFVSEIERRSGKVRT